MRLVPKTAAARAHNHPIGVTRRHAIVAGRPSEGADGLRPQDLHGAYALPAEAPIPQTVAIVDAYNDPTAEADLGVYDTEFGLHACTKANGCFKKVNQEGNESPLPANEGGWSLEISLDIETTHAVCPNCKILLVEASSESDASLEAAENTAARLGATEISNSYGGPPEATDSSAYNHPGIPVVAATGDYGYLNWEAFGSAFVGHPDYPAVSPHVVAVGGTRLKVEEGVWKGETVWNDGAPEEEARRDRRRVRRKRKLHRAALAAGSLATGPKSAAGPARASADVSADGDPFSRRRRVRLDQVPDRTGPEVLLAGCPIGGTSLASPIIASTFALAGGQRRRELPREDALRAARHELAARRHLRLQRRMRTAVQRSHRGQPGARPAEEAESVRAEAHLPRGRRLRRARPGSAPPRGSARSRRRRRR